MLPGCAAWDRLAESNQPASSEHFKPCSLHAGILCFQPLRSSAHKAGLHNDVGIFSWKELPAHRLAAVVRNQLSSRLVWKDTKGDNKVNPDGLHNDCSFGIHETEWIELCRALVLYYFISELVWDHHCSWTCFFFSPFVTWWRCRLQSWVKLESGCEERLCSHKTAASYDREYLCKAGGTGGRKWQEPSCLWIALHHCTIWYHHDPGFPGESTRFQSSRQWPSYSSSD